MTTLSLDPIQRLNIIGMLNGVECQGGRREVWAVCRLQAQLDLDDAEKAAVGYRTIPGPGGQGEYVQCSNLNGNGDHSRDFELSDDDVTRLCRAVDQCRIVLARDRKWYEPLVAQLPKPAEAVGVSA